jgi:hypothetical protein
VQLTRPKQMFVEHVDYPNHAAVHRRMMLDVDPVLNSFSGTNQDLTITVTISATDVDTLFLWMSKTQTTPPTAAQVRASGVALPGTTTTYTFTGLDGGTTYYGLAVATRQGNESDVSPMNPAFVKTLNYYSFVVREKSSGLTGVIQQVSIHKLSWNLTTQLSESNLVRYRPLSAGPLSNAFDNLGTTLITYNGNSYNVGNELFYFASPESVSSFTISYHRPAYRHGFQIFKNGVLLYTDASVATSADLPTPFIVTYNVS